MKNKRIKQKILNKFNEQEDFDADDFLGIEVEEEDRDVGIFGSVFILGFKDVNRKLWVSMPEDIFVKMLEALKPYIEAKENREAWDRAEEERWENEN